MIRILSFGGIRWYKLQLGQEVSLFFYFSLFCFSVLCCQLCWTIMRQSDRCAVRSNNTMFSFNWTKNKKNSLLYLFKICSHNLHKLLEQSSREIERVAYYIIMRKSHHISFDMQQQFSRFGNMLREVSVGSTINVI